MQEKEFFRIKSFEILQIISLGRTVTTFVTIMDFVVIECSRNLLLYKKKNIFIFRIILPLENFIHSILLFIHRFVNYHPTILRHPFTMNLLF